MTTQLTYRIWYRGDDDNWEIVPGGAEAEFDSIEDAQGMIDVLSNLWDWADTEFDIRPYP